MSDSIYDGDKLEVYPKIERASLAYTFAFNWCAMEANKVTRRIVLLLSSDFYAQELIKRFDHLEGSVIFTKDLLLPYSKQSRSLNNAKQFQSDEHVFKVLLKGSPIVIWAEPELRNGKEIIEIIVDSLNPCERIYIITTGWLAQFMPEWSKIISRPAEYPARILRCKRWIRKAGFNIKAVYGFYSLPSFLLGVLAKNFNILGWKYFADRCYFLIRKKLFHSGFRAMCSQVYILVVEKGGKQGDTLL